ncbi:hypothetical protein ACQ4PT_068267 [Festuca glaucescens]
MERSVLAQDVVLVVEPCLVRYVSLLVDALRQHVSMGFKQTAELEWISREGAVKTVDLKLLQELFNRYTMIRQFYLRAKITGVACPARLVKPAADAAATLVEPSAFVPQTEANSVVREAVIRQAAGNAGGVKHAGNVGVEPEAGAIRKFASAIVGRAATAAGHLAGGNALVKRTDAAGGNVLVQPAGNVLVKPPAVAGGNDLVKRTDAASGNVLVQHVAAGNVLVKPPPVYGGNTLVKRTDAGGGNALVKRTDAVAGIEDHAEEEAAPLSDVDEVSEHELVQQEMGDDEIGESLLEEATIPVDDEVTSELVITYDPDQPIICVGTYFANMDEFRKAFGQFCINGEFDVHKYRNTKERFEATC